MLLLNRLFAFRNLSLGRRGERYAAKWLKQRGYRILHRNLPIVDDEADVVALDPDGRTLVIIEVKTSATEHAPPETRITHTKQFRLARLASRIQQSKRYQNRPVRFDAMAIVWASNTEKPVIRHYVSAFQSPW